MKVDELRQILADQRSEYQEKAIQKGIQIRCETGEIFSVYDTGKVVCGGKRTDLTSTIENAIKSPAKGAAPVRPLKTEMQIGDIFIVYGHDTDTRDELELILRRMGLNPIVLGNLAAAGDTIIEKLESYLGEHGRVGYACVLVTPDDEGYKAGSPDQIKYRARQNVVLELGMVLARLGRKRVAILRKKTVEQPSDIDGLLYIPFAEKLDEVKIRLYQELVAAGYKPRLDAV